MPRGKNSNWMRPMLVFGHLLSTSCSCRSYVKSLRVFKRMYIVIRPAAACLQTYVYCHTTCSSYVYCHIDTQAERHADRDNMYIVVCILSRSRTLTRAPAHVHDATQAEEKRVVSLLQAKCSSLEKELGEAKRNGAVSTTSCSPVDSTSSVATSKSAATCAPHLGLGGDFPGQEVGGRWMEVKTPSRGDDDNADLQECQGGDYSFPITQSSPSAACIAPVSPTAGI
jgi:hypothetical protein